MVVTEEDRVLLTEYELQGAFWENKASAYVCLLFFQEHALSLSVFFEWASKDDHFLENPLEDFFTAYVQQVDGDAREMALPGRFLPLGQLYTRMHHVSSPLLGVCNCRLCCECRKFVGGV